MRKNFIMFLHVVTEIAIYQIENCYGFIRRNVSNVIVINMPLNGGDTEKMRDSMVMIIIIISM